MHVEYYNLESQQILSDSITVSYSYDMHKRARNKPYVRKENKHEMFLVAISIENKSSIPINITEQSFLITTDAGRKVNLISEWDYSAKVAQSPGQFFLFYSLAGLGAYQEGNTLNITYNFIPMIIGALNAGYAIANNNKHENDVHKNTIFDKTVQPGETLNGCITLQESTHPALNFTYIPIKAQ